MFRIVIHFIRQLFRFDRYGTVKVALIYVIGIFSYVLLLKPAWHIGGDGFWYYSYLRSLIYDGDLDFRNEAMAFDNVFNTTTSQRLTNIGVVANPFAIGTPLLLSPFVFIVKLSGLAESTSNFYGISGYSFGYEASIFLSAVVFGGIGVCLMLNLLKQHIQTGLAAILSLAMIYTTPLIFYIIYEPSMSHIYSFSMITGALYFFNLTVKSAQFRDYLGLYFFLGISYLVRWQNLILFVVVTICLVIINKRIKLAQWLGFGLFSIFVALQSLVWNMIYGSFFTIPQGNNFFSIQSGRFFIIDFLFNFPKGLFVWNPIYLICTIGLILFIWGILAKKEKFDQFSTLASVSFIVVTFQIIINAGIWDWHGSSAFGNRRMSDYTSLLCLGIVYIFIKFANNSNGNWWNKHYKFIWILMVGILIFHNFINMILVSRGIVKPYI